MGIMLSDTLSRLFLCEIFDLERVRCLIEVSYLQKELIDLNPIWKKKRYINKQTTTTKDFKLFAKLHHLNLEGIMIYI